MRIRTHAQAPRGGHPDCARPAAFISSVVTAPRGIDASRPGGAADRPAAPRFGARGAPSNHRGRRAPAGGAAGGAGPGGRAPGRGAPGARAGAHAHVGRMLHSTHARPATTRDGASASGQAVAANDARAGRGGASSPGRPPLSALPLRSECFDLFSRWGVHRRAAPVARRRAQIWLRVGSSPGGPGARARRAPGGARRAPRAQRRAPRAARHRRTRRRRAARRRLPPEQGRT
jgi:hypothetical protein